MHNLTGTVTINRSCYRCSKCGYKFIPADEKLDLPESQISKNLLKALSMVVVFIPFDYAQKFIKDLLDVHLSKRFLQSVVYKTGQKIADYFQSPVTGKEHIELLSDEGDPANLVYVFTDGSFAPVLETDEKTGKKTMNYRENKLGLVVNAADIIKKETSKGKEITRITRKRFVTSLAEGTEPFKLALKKLLTITKSMQAKTIVLISDGAEWIGGLRRDIIPNAVKILIGIMPWNTSGRQPGDTLAKMPGTKLNNGSGQLKNCS